jgi:hypothetical protein
VLVDGTVEEPDEPPSDDPEVLELPTDVELPSDVVLPVEDVPPDDEVLPDDDVPLDDEVLLDDVLPPDDAVAVAVLFGCVVVVADFVVASRLGVVVDVVATTGVADAVVVGVATGVVVTVVVATGVVVVTGVGVVVVVDVDVEHVVAEIVSADVDTVPPKARALPTHPVMLPMLMPAGSTSVPRNVEFAPRVVAPPGVQNTSHADAVPESDTTEFAAEVRAPVSRKMYVPWPLSTMPAVPTDAAPDTQ